MAFVEAIDGIVHSADSKFQIIVFQIIVFQIIVFQIIVGGIMLEAGPAIKVTIYLNQDTGSSRGFLHEDILAFLLEKGLGMGGATVLKPFAGFGSRGRLHKADEGDTAGLHLPIVIFFVDSPAKVNAVLPRILDMVTDGLVEAHPTEILKSVAGREKVIS